MTPNWLKPSFQQLLNHRTWMTRTGSCVKASACNHFASKYGVMDKGKHSKQPKPGSHNRFLKKLKRMGNEARRDLRRARREDQDELVIQEIAKQFHNLTRMHSKAQKVSLRSRAYLETRKARSECDKSLWRFAAKILDDDRLTNTTPPFSSHADSRKLLHKCL